MVCAKKKTGAFGLPGFLKRLVSIHIRIVWYNAIGHLLEVVVIALQAVVNAKHILDVADSCIQTVI